MKFKQKFNNAFDKLKNTIHFITLESIERLGGFLRATIEQKPLLNILEGAEDLLEKALNSLEKQLQKKRIKQPQKYIKREHILKRQTPDIPVKIPIQNNEPKRPQELYRETFLRRLEELRILHKNELIQQRTGLER